MVRYFQGIRYDPLNNVHNMAMLLDHGCAATPSVDLVNGTWFFSIRIRRIIDLDMILPTKIVISQSQLGILITRMPFFRGGTQDIIKLFGNFLKKQPMVNNSISSLRSPILSSSSLALTSHPLFQLAFFLVTTKTSEQNTTHEHI